MFHEFGKRVYLWMVNHGIDPFYGLAVGALGMLFVLRREIGEFRALDADRRVQLVIEVLFATFVVLVAIAHALGILPRG